MSVREVVETKDLVEHIVKCTYASNMQLGPNAWLIAELRELMALVQVNRLFREVAQQYLGYIWAGYRRGMNGFVKTVDEYTSLPYTFERIAIIENLKREIREWSVWPQPLYGGQLLMAPSKHALFDDTVHCWMYTIRPKDNKEMLQMLEGKCAVCDGRCHAQTKNTETGTSFKIPAGKVAPIGGASFVHPYRGKLRDTVRCMKIGCACDLVELECKFLPHTHYDHTFEIDFYHYHDASTVEFEYDVRLAGMFDPMVRSERDARSFIIGARTYPWYQPRIKRLFGLRPPGTFNEKNCCKRRKAVCDWTEFPATIFLLAPRMTDNADCSLQQIFGLSREEALAVVRRGRAMRRERVLLED